MKIRCCTDSFKRALSVPVSLYLVIVVVVLSASGGSASQSEERELAEYRNEGAAHYENQDYKKAVAVLEECARISNESGADLVNLGLALFKAQDYEKAIPTLEKAREVSPEFLHCAYALGLIYKRLDSLDKAAEEFEKVIAGDPGDPPAHYSLGVVCNKLGQDDRAIEAFQAAVRFNPEHPSAHYYLYKYAKSQKRPDEAKRELRIFKRLQKAIPDRQRTEEVFEEGQYLKLILPPYQSFSASHADLRASLAFHDVTEASQLPPTESRHLGPYERTISGEQFGGSFIPDTLLPSLGGGVVLADLDGDGHRDIYLVRSGITPEDSENKLYLNQGNGSFRDATAASGAGDRGIGVGAAVGDFDNDGALDVYILNIGANVLYQNDGGGSFTDVTDTAGTGDSGDAADAVFFDYDHDGDLDLAVVNNCDTSWTPDADKAVFPLDFPGRKNVLYRNNGDSTFTAVDDTLWASGDAARSHAISFGDCDDDEDTDLLVINEDVSSCILYNEREGRFASPEGLSEAGAYLGNWCDLDNDGLLDIVLVGRGGTFIYHRDDGNHWVPREVPALSGFVGSKRATALKLLDFDNDGLVDILLAADDGRLGLFANEGSGTFSLFSKDLTGTGNDGAAITSLDAGDIDGDGDLDIAGAGRGGTLFLLENRGAESAHWLEVQTVGERVSLQGIGAMLEVKSGRYYQRRDVTEWPVHIGLGTVDRVDVLRVTWTNGIVQNMLSVPINQKYRVEEIVRTDASCPFLFTFDGERFHYINDILGVAAMGVPFDEGVYHMPDPDEYVKIKGELIQPSDGRYLLRLAQELKECCYLDHIRLIAVDHPADVDVYPNERFSEPPFAEPGIHTVEDKRYPRRAFDHNGRDVLSLIRQQDLEYPADITMSSYDGLAERNWIELDLGDLSGRSRVMLFLTGWIYWSSSSANVAVAQNRKLGFEALVLQVIDSAGNWVAALDDVGLPNGKNSTIPVDLTDRFLTDDYRVRLITNMVIYWDEIFFTVDEESAQVSTDEAGIVAANLHYRGFSAMAKDQVGMEHFDYHQSSRYGPWRQHEGRYTRYGDVAELLLGIDDRYVIFGAGDEISLSFDATALPDLPKGWFRDYFFYAYGWIKDGDLNTVHSKTVDPLPFRGMPGYPYHPRSHPRAQEIERDLAEYLTRERVETVGRLTRDGASGP